MFVEKGISFVKFKMFETFCYFLFVATCLSVGRGSTMDEVTAVRGETVRLPCFLLPDVKHINWTSDNIGLISENWRVLPTTERFRIEQNRTRDWTLVIENVQFSDEGVYTCSCSGTHKYEVKVQLHIRDRDVVTMRSTEQANAVTSESHTSTRTGDSSFYSELSEMATIEMKATTMKQAPGSTKTNSMLSEAASNGTTYTMILFIFLTCFHKITFVWTVSY